MPVMDGINCFRDLAARFFLKWELHTVSDLLTMHYTPLSCWCVKGFCRRDSLKL